MQAVQSIVFFDRRAQRAAGKENILQCLYREIQGLIAFRLAPLSDRSIASEMHMPTDRSVAKYRCGVAAQ